MKTRSNRIILCTMLPLIGVWLSLFTVLGTTEPKMEVKEIPPPRPQIMADVVTRDLDLLKVTSDWPASLTVENISDKKVSGFTIEIFAANDDGGPGRYIGWGKNPGFGVKNPLFKSGEVMTLPIDPEIVETFEANNKPFLYIQLVSVWVDNDPTYEYHYSALLKQDPKNPKHYIVAIDAKGRSKHRHNHPVPHITHSVQPPFVLGCCNRMLLDAVLIDCDTFDPCQPPPARCYVENNAYTFCTFCCTDLKVTNNFLCRANCLGGATCPESKFVTHSNPCTCCNC